MTVLTHDCDSSRSVGALRVVVQRLAKVSATIHRTTYYICAFEHELSNRSNNGVQRIPELT